MAEVATMLLDRNAALSAQRHVSDGIARLDSMADHLRLAAEDFHCAQDHLRRANQSATLIVVADRPSKAAA